MPKNILRAPDAPPPGGPYSQAVRAGNLVFLAGQGPFRADGSRVEGSFEDEARQTFENIAAVARASGGSLADAVRIGVYLRDMDDFPVMNRIYGELIPEPHPARTTIQSNLPGFSIEVDAVLLIED